MGEFILTGENDRRRNQSSSQTATLNNIGDGCGIDNEEFVTNNYHWLAKRSDMKTQGCHG